MSECPAHYIDNFLFFGKKKHRLLGKQSVESGKTARGEEHFLSTG